MRRPMKILTLLLILPTAATSLLAFWKCFLRASNSFFIHLTSSDLRGRMNRMNKSTRVVEVTVKRADSVRLVFLTWKTGATMA